MEIPVIVAAEIINWNINTKIFYCLFQWLGNKNNEHRKSNILWFDLFDERLLVKSGHITIIPINNHHAFIYQDWHLLRRFPKTFYSLIVLYQATLFFSWHFLGKLPLQNQHHAFWARFFNLQLQKSTRQTRKLARFGVVTGREPPTWPQELGAKPNKTWLLTTYLGWFSPSMVGW